MPHAQRFPALPYCLALLLALLAMAGAWYWLGRAAEAGGPGKTAEFYTKAASFPSTFYGQLASERLGRKTLNVAYPSPSAADRQNLQSREAVQAISRLEAAGHGWRAALRRRRVAQSRSRSIARQPMSRRWNSLSQWIASTPA